MNIRRNSIKNALLSFGLLLFVGSLSLAVSTSVSARPDRDIPFPDVPDIPFSFCPPPDQLDPSTSSLQLTPTEVHLIEERYKFGSGFYQKLFISVRNDGGLEFVPLQPYLIEVHVNGTPFKGFVYGGPKAQRQLGGAIERCETGGISLNATFPIGTFQIGQKVKVFVPAYSFKEVTLTIQ
jgi:hypothetical protein